jgi:hypothetical protein
MTTAWGGFAGRHKRALLTLAAAAIATGGFVCGRAASGATNVEVVRGEVERVALDGVGVRLADRDDPNAVFFVGAASSWFDMDGIHHGPGQPECLPPDSRGAVVEFGVVPELEGGYSNKVVWTRCITLPTGFLHEEEFTPLPLDQAYEQALEREDQSPGTDGLSLNTGSETPRSADR